ncbi:MAG TPA: putative glycolipid-binding domain-containing protein [Gemmatimonadaceae bacterium]|nr:putative glycolipid-binding domain-containing protein [Gemmatimonadaceae bacterium]
MSEGEAILWRRLDLPGHDAATIKPIAHGWRVSGVAILVDSARPCRVEYDVDCDTSWLTRRCSLRGHVGAMPVALDVRRGVSGTWTVDGADAPGLRGCMDIDLGFTPATNLLPIRRLKLDIGQPAVVRAAWIRFPEFTAEVLDQVYTRQAEYRYLYESGGGVFRCELQVDPFGCVVDYPGLWRAEATLSLSSPLPLS